LASTWPGLLADDWYQIDRYVVWSASQHPDPGPAPPPVLRLACGRGDRVAILPYCRSGQQVVLIRQFRLPVLLVEPAGQGASVEIAGGLIDAESAECVARRELREETGLEAAQLKLALTTFCHPVLVTERTFIFLAPMDDLAGFMTPGRIHHSGENIEILVLTLPEALEMIASQVIKDAKTIMALYHLAWQDPGRRRSE
jgi:nudix-type nucleoside diphosphatase (YffH/AdpP family)